jgi:hypothetical protein
LTQLHRDVIVSSEVRMYRDKSGRLYAEHIAGAWSSWRPYTQAFGALSVAARLRDKQPKESGHLAEGEGVSVTGLPFYSGLGGLVRKAPSLLRSIGQLGTSRTVFIGRMPELLSILLYLRARALRAPFIALVVSDPIQLGAVTPGLRGRLVGRILAGITKNAVQHSAAVIYVTQNWLQELYPARHDTPTIGRSNVIIGESEFAAFPRAHTAAPTSPMLVTIATLGAATKGIDNLLAVVSALRSQGQLVTLTVIGGGAAKDDLKRHARLLGIEDDVRFLGHVSDKAQLIHELDRAHCYVSMSKAEGLSRGMVEAMARGLPVVASDAGGTSELISDEFMVDIGDESAMVQKLIQVFSSPQLLDRMSVDNISTAHRVVELAAPQRLTDFLVASLAKSSIRSN